MVNNRNLIEFQINAGVELQKTREMRKLHGKKSIKQSNTFAGMHQARV